MLNVNWIYKRCRLVQWSTDYICAFSLKHGFKCSRCARYCDSCCHIEYLLRSGTFLRLFFVSMAQWLNRPIFNSEQLTFTPNWGKRSNSPLFGGFNTNGGNGGSGATNNAGITTSSTTTNFNGNGCKTSLDSLMMIYRLIQASFSILPFSSFDDFHFFPFFIFPAIDRPRPKSTTNALKNRRKIVKQTIEMDGINGLGWMNNVALTHEQFCIELINVISNRFLLK